MSREKLVLTVLGGRFLRDACFCCVRSNDGASDRTPFPPPCEGVTIFPPCEGGITIFPPLLRGGQGGVGRESWKSKNVACSPFLGPVIMGVTCSFIQ